MTPSLEQQLGTLLMVGFSGELPTGRHHIIRDIKEYHLGGVILFDKLLATGSTTNNINSPTGVSQLTTLLQSFRETPLLIAVDQEGGMVSRFKEKNGFPTTPTAEVLGESIEATRNAARQTAKMLKDAGVNWNLAPSADVNSYANNPIIGKYGRSFSVTPSKVREHNRAWIEEHDKQGVLSCLKHFPGHGSSRTDSHKGFTDITSTWHEQELIPYKDAIKDNQEPHAIMIGHLFHEKFDSHMPASLSHKVIQNLLREQLQFNGLVITDDMQMGAIVNDYGLKEACYLSLKAGADMLIIGNNLHYDSEIVPKIIKYLKKSIYEGRLSEHHIKKAYNRVLKLQQSI